MEEYYLICEDSLEGVFTGIYNAYLMKKPHKQVHLLVSEEDNYRLFAVYKQCPVEEHKAAKVARTIVREFGEETYLAFCRALATSEEDKAEAVYRTVVTGFGMKNKRALMGHLSDPYVHRVFELARNVANEAHHHVEFLRFCELKGGVLLAQIGPKNNIVTFITPHFADRLPLENFVIQDENRNIFAVHPSGKDWFLVTGQEGMKISEMPVSEGEEKYGELFCHFFHTIAIKERKNIGLQRNMLPIRYRKYMTEFIKN